MTTRTRSALALALVLAVAASPAAAGAAPAAAAASTQTASKPAPKLKIVSAHSNGFAVSWPAAVGVHPYETQVSTRSDFAGAKRVQRYTSRYVGDLKQNTTYHVRYRAVSRVAGKDRYSSSSTPTTARTVALYPARFTSVTHTRQANAITVKWSPVAHASS